MEEGENQAVENAQHQEELERVKNAILDGTFDIKKYYNVTEDGLKAINAIAVQLYTNKKYEQAMNVFSILSMLDPSGDRYYAQAAAAFMLGNYDLAFMLYSMSILFGKYTPILFEQLAECCAHLNKTELLYKYANESIRLSHEEEFKNNKVELKYAERAKLILGKLDNLIKEKETEVKEDQKK